MCGVMGRKEEWGDAVWWKIQWCAERKSVIVVAVVVVRVWHCVAAVQVVRTLVRSQR